MTRKVTDYNPTYCNIVKLFLEQASVLVLTRIPTIVQPDGNGNTKYLDIRVFVQHHIFYLSTTCFKSISQEIHL